MSFLGKFLPASRNGVVATHQRLDNISQQLDRMERSLKNLESRITQIESGVKDDVKKVRKDIANVHKNTGIIRDDLFGTTKVVKKVKDDLFDTKNLIMRRFDDTNKHLVETEENTREINWGIVFKDTITDSRWLKKQTFSLGRWAIGYQAAYALYRVLDEFRPKSILELGLGQSTKITSQYTEYYQDVQHAVVEHDNDWIEFYKNNYELPKSTNIIQCDWGTDEYNGVSGIRVYQGFGEKLEGKKFELMVIDGPLGGDMPEYARIDVLKLMPECLAESFVIILDDVNRSGEQNTFQEMKKVLEQNEISYAEGVYAGKKVVKMLVSKDLAFLTSM